MSFIIFIVAIFTRDFPLSPSSGHFHRESAQTGFYDGLRSIRQTSQLSQDHQKISPKISKAIKAIDRGRLCSCHCYDSDLCYEDFRLFQWNDFLCFNSTFSCDEVEKFSVKFPQEKHLRNKKKTEKFLSLLMALLNIVPVNYLFCSKRGDKRRQQNFFNGSSKTIKKKFPFIFEKEIDKSLIETSAIISIFWGVFLFFDVC